jgi:dienelactone hydrolase
MNLLASSVVAALAICQSDALAETSPPGYTDHSRLMVYLDGNGVEQPVKSPDDWSIRRKHILDGMQAAMGQLPDRVDMSPLDVKVTTREAGRGYVRLTISLVAKSTDRVPAYLYLPEVSPAGKPVAAMLALHPTSPLGKDVVDGRGPRPNRAYARELAERGYVVLAPDYPSFGDYTYDFADDEYVSGTMKGVFNHMRCVDLLQSRPEVDPRRIGVMGHSLGGHNAMFVGAFDERLKVIVSSCGWTPFHDYYGGNIRGWTSDRYMPRLNDVYRLDPDRLPFDFYEVVAALAPRAFFSSSPLHDGNFGVRGVRKAEQKAGQVFTLLDVRDRFVVRYPDCDHDFPPHVRREAYRFVDRVLRHAPSREVPEE